MDLSHSTTSSSANETRALNTLLDVFGCAFSHDDIADAYMKANGDVIKAGDFLTDLQLSLPHSNDVDPGVKTKATKIEKAVEENYMENSSQPRTFSQIGQAAEEMHIENSDQTRMTGKLHKYSAASGTVSGMLGKESVTATATANIASKQDKPLKVELLECIRNDFKVKSDESDSAPRRETLSYKDAEEFLFSMLGEGSKLSMEVICEVLGSCGYDIKKTLEEWISYSGKGLGEKAESKHNVIQDVAVECSVSKGRCLASQSSMSACSSQEGMQRRKSQIFPRELVEAVLTVPRRLVDEPKVTRCQLGANRSGVPDQKPVLKPLDDFPNKVIIGSKAIVKNSGCRNWEDNSLPAYMSWFDCIPPPSDMVLPKLEWRGTCIGHAYAECLTSRRRLMAENNEAPIDQVTDVSIPWLVQELTKSGALTKFGGKTLDVSEYIRKYGAPLVGKTERAYISDYRIAGLTNLQDILVFDLPDVLNTAKFLEVLDERVALLMEIDENGPVVGLFNAGPHWPDANGKIYYDNCGHEFSRSKGDEGMSFGPHASLIYGFDNSANDPFDIELLLLDNMGPTVHSEGHARMNISSLRGYIAPYVCNYRSDGCPVGTSISRSNLMVTNHGENERVKYAVSYMQGWCDSVEDYHSAFPDLDEWSSFFGVYDGHGGPTTALYCAENFHNEFLHQANYHSDPENAMKKTFIRIDSTLVDIWRKSTKRRGVNVCPLMKALCCEESEADFSTACAVLIRGNRIIIGNAGDSRAVLSRNGQALDLNIRHRVDYLSKRHVAARIIKDKCGGSQRILGNLDISKVIGFAPYKAYTDLGRKELVVTCEPDIHTETITDDTDFLVIASDGIWNHMQSQSVVDFIHRHLEQSPQEETNLGTVCERLLAYCNPGGDNMTIMLVQFKMPAVASAVASRTEPGIKILQT